MKTDDLEKLIESVPIPVLAIGPAQTIIAANEAARGLLGDHALGRHYITALRQPSLLDKIETAARTGSPTQGQYLGHESDVDTTYTVHIGLAGDVQVLSFQDTTAAVEAGQMRRDFVANVSHELRTPLTALMGFIETLKGAARDDPGARSRFLGIMEREAGRMTRLVDDLLSLSRVEAAERVRPNEQIALSSVIHATIAELSPMIETSGCEVTFEDNSEDQAIPADPAQLRQVVGNLIENALKYGGGSGRIDISLSSAEQQSSLRASGLCLVVKDYGEGIEEHHLARLTERFYRVDSHRSRSVGGTGLGLAIVKHIVNRHRGRLLIESVVGEGTQIKVILPIT